MKLPIRALYEIRAYSRPISRPDWRTCKLHESRIIKLTNQDTRNDAIEILSKYAIVGYLRPSRQQEVGREMNEWTHYGRLKILNQKNRWLQCQRSPRECYAKRMWDITRNWHGEGWTVPFDIEMKPLT